ncbi:MAG: hypothetical protein B7O98_07255 [Zestosphaera tikiterensis]|uniref:Uncharacterized protein n=1 Tax=Zestosphaera tikiterensis TaxID=1973259 RepID=A0A2R7Y4N4_9CREN|nr:MAG: hypothetical protein B7O98_07255 [Zestosphaera tikiterensis]
MKHLTIVAAIPPTSNHEYLRKIWRLKNYLMEEVGIEISVIVISDNGEPRLIALDEIIDLRDSIQNIVRKIASVLVDEVSDPDFIEKVVGGIEEV